MKDYELVLVFDPDLSSEKQKKLASKIKKIIIDLQGEVDKQTEWGKKDLTYPLLKKTQGYYFLWAIKLPPKSPAEIDKKLRLEEEVVRYLLVKKEKTRGGVKKKK